MRTPLLARAAGRAPTPRAPSSVAQLAALVVLLALLGGAEMVQRRMMQHTERADHSHHGPAHRPPQAEVPSPSAGGHHVTVGESGWQQQLLHSANHSSLRHLRHPPAPARCRSPAPDIDYDRLLRELNAPGSENNPNSERLVVLDYACVDQEAIVLYDPSLFDDSHEKALPRMDVSEVQFFYRHAPQDLVQEATARVQQQPQALQQGQRAEGAAQRLVKGGMLPYAPLQVRRASSAEAKALRSPFSACTVPMVYTSHYLHNFAEFFSRAPSRLWTYQHRARILPPDITLAVHFPAKVPLPSFVPNLLRPFSKYEPVDFADLSSRLPEGSPSNSTAEGTHIRCFRKIMLWRGVGGSYPGMPPAGRLISEHYAPQVDALAATQEAFWASAGNPSTMRVLVEVRPDKGTRQILKLDALLDACRSWVGAFEEPPEATRASGPGPRGYRQVECRAITFGSWGFLYDLFVLREADVLVGVHGAGQTNSNFMPEHSSLLEVRGNRASDMWVGNIWNPLISHQSGFAFFWWGLFLEDPSLATEPALDAEGLGDAVFAARDQNVELRWEHLLPMLRRIAAVNKDLATFRSLWGDKADHVVFDLMPGAKQLTPHGPLL